ncbi:hypothetical protein NIES23_22000 [Trichormus variabilis NIES-23]|uniref:Uncharacterized protein n=1 Tax=Trichormus variabilis NIES-23 TaxID=1973479 RepID=A0A1Z4KKB0_ANAVA|nr:hypothetical protein NIES23_22000 [Trichormus variabilis NIES-23]
MGAAANKLSTQPNNLSSSANSCQLNTKAACTPLCAVISASGLTSAGCSNRFFSKRCIIADKDKSGFRAKYRPTNSKPKGKYPSHSHNCFATSNSLSIRSGVSASKDRNNCNAASGCNTSKDSCLMAAPNFWRVVINTLNLEDAPCR